MRQTDRHGRTDRQRMFEFVCVCIYKSENVFLYVRENV